MTTINQASLMRNSGPNLTQAEVAMEMVAQRANGDLKVSRDSTGTTVNGKPLSDFVSEAKISKDIVSFSPAATAAISNQQVALDIIQYSQNKSKSDVKSNKTEENVGTVTLQAALQNTSLTGQSPDSSMTPIGESIIGSEDPTSVIAAYAQESPTERFYNSSQDPSSISSEFFSNSEQQASYIAAYNSGTLNIQDTSQFMKSDSESTTKFNAGGMSSSASGSNQLDLSSIKDDNIFTFSDPIAGSIVISWNNKK